MSEEAPSSLRVDKWLWHARFFKTRSLAAKQVSEGKVRVNGTRISKPARSVVPGDTLTFPQAKQIRVVTILALGARRGPAPEAQALYEDRSPPPEPTAPKAERGGPRPTKKDRRNLLSQRSNPLD